MAWIESHTNLGRHPKTRRLCRLLQISLPQAVGHLHLLWHWVLEFAEDGDLTPMSDQDLADAACWDGNAETFVRALVRCGFLDQDGSVLRVHDWRDYAGRLLADRERKRLRPEGRASILARDGYRCWYCGATSDLTIDHVIPLARGGSNDTDNLVTACRRCNTSKGARTPDEWLGREIG